MQLSHLIAAAVVCHATVGFAQTRYAMPADELHEAVARHRVLGAVQPVDAHTVIAEAEEFDVTTNAQGWRPIPWGENYYAATLALTFLSRKACLSAPPSCAAATAQRSVIVPEAGRYRVLARYESPYRFATAFRVVVEQNGKTVLDRAYGHLTNEKIWGFRQGVKDQVQWSWGAVENPVWEGHDAFVELQPGEATIRLIAAEQTQPAAKRNVDLIMLTKDDAEFDRQLEKAPYLPLDGMITQTGDVFARVTNRGDKAIKVTFDICRQHSPYWIHVRRWEPIAVTVEPMATSEWFDVGALLDTFNDGQWDVHVRGDDAPQYTIDFSAPAEGGRASLGSFDFSTPAAQFAYDGDTRYTRRIRTNDRVLYDLVDELKTLPVRGKAPTLTPIYFYTFDRRPEDKAYEAALAQFMQLMGLPPLADGVNRPAGYIDVRHLDDAKLRAELEAMKADGRADDTRVVSLGDEIQLPRPGGDVNAAFVAYLKERNVTLADLGVADWADVRFNLKPEPGGERLHYHAVTFREDFGIASIKKRTDLLREYLPGAGAGIGANFSPHHGTHYLGETFQWVTTFRRGGMTMPWSEDYIWQVPVGTPQMNAINFALFRAGMKNHPEGDVHFYVMPHAPGNTPAMWRRLFHQAIGAGATIINLFEFRPVQAAYTENHVTDIGMYQAVRTGFHELGLYEDIVQSGHVRPGDAALWFGRVGDMYHDSDKPFGAAKRTLFIAARLQQLQVDAAAEEDATDGSLDRYKMLFVTDRHVRRDHAEGIAAWVRRGGRLVLTAGAMAADEYDQPLDPFGIGPRKVRVLHPDLQFAKQDLPFVEAKDVMGVPMIGAREDLGDAGTIGLHSDFGNGKVHRLGFLPGLSLFKPAMPMTPPDRGSTDDASSHFLPTQFNPRTMQMLEAMTADVPRPVVAGDPLVASHVIESPAGVAVVLVNWQRQPARDLRITLNFDAPRNSAMLASGGKVARGDDGAYLLDLDVADVLILR